MKRTLAAEFRRTFFKILLLAIAATTLTWGGSALLFYHALERGNLLPANYYEKAIPHLEELIQREKQNIFSPEGEALLRQEVKGEGLGITALNEKGERIYGEEEGFSEELLLKSLNTTFRKGDRYIKVVPVFENSHLEGGILLSYTLKVTPLTRGWSFLLSLGSLLFLSPFLYILLFTTIFSRKLAGEIKVPLDLLQRASEKVRDRDLDFTLSYDKENELGEVCRSFSEMQEALKASFATQWAMEEERKEMTEALLHDLKSPLSVLRVYTEALEGPGGEEEETRKRYLSVIGSNIKKAQNFLEQVEDITLLEGGRRALVKTTFSFERFLEEKAEEYTLQGKEKNLPFRLLKEGPLPEEITTDPEALERILDNLFANALSHTEEGEISLRVQGMDPLNFVMEDTGSGFTPKDLKYALHRFYRGDPARKSDGNWGLGLTVALELARALGGDLSLAKGDKGAKVLFHIRTR